jgi:uncharacterized protein
VRNVLIDAGPLIALFADGSLLWLAHESGLREIMTVDVKDFARYRLPDGDALALL